MTKNATSLTTLPADQPVKVHTRIAASIVVPAIIADAGESATRRFLEFFAATIRNKKTRVAYYRAVCQVLRLVRPPHDPRHRRDRAAAPLGLHRGHARRLREAVGQAAPGRHPHAVRLAGDQPGHRRQPGNSVRGPKHVVKRGKTSLLTGEQARELLDSIDTSTVVGLRDRALISVMTFAFARVSAVVALRVEDYYPQGKR